MNKGIRKSLIYGMLTVMISVLLSGCGIIRSTGLSDEEDELVAEYAAGVIMRYSADKKGGLGDLRPTPTPIPWVDPATVEPQGTDEQEEDEEETEDQVPFEEVAGKEDIAQGSAGGGAFNGHNLAGTIGIGDFDISYEGYEIVDMYPESTEGDLSFSMQATAGRKLLVVHLNVINEGSEEKVCDALACNVKYRILINETTRVNEQMTILLNDLKSYNESIAAGSAADTVLVFEIEEAVASNIGSLSLVVVNSEGESVFALN